MLWRWLKGAIAVCEGADLYAQTFEDAYYARYRDKLEQAAPSLGWSAREQATAYGRYQILGENLARHAKMKRGDLDRFLADARYQDAVGREFFYWLLGQLMKRRGVEWPRYLYSMWNAGVNFNAAYDEKMRRALQRGA
jgi:hypothetical protein